MWGRLIAAFCSVLIAPTFAAAQDSADLKMGVGSKLFWGAAEYPYSETILAVKDDFVIYLNDEIEGDVPTPEEYYVIFSGIYFETCGAEMPSKAQRDAFADFLPLKEGAKLVTQVSDGVTFEVTGRSKPFLMGKYRDAHRIEISYDNDDYGGETIDVIDALPLNVRLDYGDESVYRLNLLTSSDQIGVQDGLEQQNIGNCASLITK